MLSFCVRRYRSGSLSRMVSDFMGGYKSFSLRSLDPDQMGKLRQFVVGLVVIVNATGPGQVRCVKKVTGVVQRAGDYLVDVGGHSATLEVSDLCSWTSLVYAALMIT